MTMTIVLRSQESLQILKNRLRDQFFREIKSGHLSEAIAAMLGFKTHHALLAALDESVEPLELSVSRDDFIDRLLSIAPGSDAKRIRDVNFAGLLDRAVRQPSIPGPNSVSQGRTEGRVGPRPESSFVKRAKRKARKLQQSLERRVAGEVYQTDCQDWIAAAFGFRSLVDLLSDALAQPVGEYDERLTSGDLVTRRNTQAKSLAAEFEVDLETARHVIDEVRPTSHRFSNGDD